MTAPAVHSLHMLVHLLLLVPRCLPACPAGLHVDVLHSLLLILLLPPLPALQTCMIRYTMGGRVGGQVNLELPRLTEELKLASPSSCCLLCGGWVWGCWMAVCCWLLAAAFCCWSIGLQLEYLLAGHLPLPAAGCCAHASLQLASGHHPWPH
jgi:hypothetical protein